MMFTFWLSVHTMHWIMRFCFMSCRRAVYSDLLDIAPLSAATLPYQIQAQMKAMQVWYDIIIFQDLNWISMESFFRGFSHSGFLPLSPLGPKWYCRTLRAPPPPPHTLFWLLQQHGATDLIHNSYKHSIPPSTFFTQGQRSRSKIRKKFLLTR